MLDIIARRHYARLIYIYSVEHAFCKACVDGRLDVIQWIIRFWPEVNVRYQNDLALKYVCRYNHLHLIDYFKNIHLDIIIFQLDTIFKIAICYSHNKLLKRLVEFYGSDGANNLIAICLSFRRRNFYSMNNRKITIDYILKYIINYYSITDYEYYRQATRDHYLYFIINLPCDLNSYWYCHKINQQVQDYIDELITSVNSGYQIKSARKKLKL